MAVQLYCEKLGLYADLGDDADFSFSLQNPYQHFYEEPEDFSYSQSLPITPNNLKIFESGYELEIVVDNYVVLKRFYGQIISKSLTEMEVSLYKTRVNKLMSIYEGNLFSYKSFVKSGLYEESYAYCSFDEFNKRNRKHNCFLMKAETQYYWKDDEGDEFIGDGNIVRYNDANYTLAVFNIPLRDALGIMLGYVPQEYENDTTYIRIPINFKEFRLYGKVRQLFSWGFRPSSIQYRPKYYPSNTNTKFPCFHTPTDAGSTLVHNSNFYKNYQFEFTQDDFRFTDDTTKSRWFNVLYTDKQILSNALGVSKGTDFRGVSSAIYNGNNALEFDVDDVFDLTQVGWQEFPITPSMILSNYWEEFAKQLPLVCDYNKVPETLYRNTAFELRDSNIISWKETTKLDGERVEFKFDFGGLNPYWFTTKEHIATDIKKLTIGDLWIESKDDNGNVINFPMLITSYGGKNFYRPSRCKYNNNKFEPITPNTHLFCANYVQNIKSEVECDCINYDFSSSVRLGSRWFVVDKVQTSDFKKFKLTMVEDPNIN